MNLVQRLRMNTGTILGPAMREAADEIERLTKEVEQYKSAYLEQVRLHNETLDELAQLERENAALLADARRMDWIQRQDFDDLYFIIFQDQPNDGKYGVSQGCIGKGWAIGDTFRAAIDAAIDAEMAKGEA